MIRYKVEDKDRAKFAINADEYIFSEGEWDDDYSSYLIDTLSNEIVFCDRMEPEDATLDRDLKPLVDLLNKAEQHQFRY